MSKKILEIINEQVTNLTGLKLDIDYGTIIILTGVVVFVVVLLYLAYRKPRYREEFKVIRPHGEVQYIGKREYMKWLKSLDKEARKRHAKRI